MNTALLVGMIAPFAFYLGRLGYHRLLLSMATHPSLRGHARLARLTAKLVPFYEYEGSEFFRADGAPASVGTRRQLGFDRLGASLRERAPKTLELGAQLECDLSDVAFTNSYRVPFQFRNYVARRLKVGNVLEESSGAKVRDMDGNWSYDLSGSYGLNVFGYDFYKGCIERGLERVKDLGPVLGQYHPLIADNARRLKAISGLDEVSFHMSGTEAVMQAVRLARFHTGRSHVVRFCGAYHGWWDGVQAGVGNPRPAHEVYTLKDMDEDSLRVLRTRRDIACVLVNPIQAMHPNANSPSDSMLIASDRKASFDKQAYSAWLRRLREVCTEHAIPLIFDEVFLGFRLAYGGAQEYFGVRADIVTYGKTVGGGLPIGVVCGRRDLVRRFRDDRPTDICFARGTFNSHPLVMATMNEFLREIERPALRASYENLDAVWDRRAGELNARLEEARLPVQVANMTAIWTTLYNTPSRYNWMFQYYLRAEGLSLSWIGSGRFIFSHDYSEQDYQAVADKFVNAATAMHAEGWWWCPLAASNKHFKRRVLRELITVALRRRASGQTVHP